MRTTIRAAVAAAVLLALAGCSHGEVSPRDPSSTWTPTGKMETPTSAAPDPVEPELPAAAAEASEAGARAFIQYYWELINYAQVTGNVKALRAVSNANCGGCNGGIKRIRKQYRGGGHVIGGDHTVAISAIRPLSIDSGELTGFHATVATQHDAQTLIDRDGTEEAIEPGAATFEMYLIWTPEGHWRVDVMEIR